jgi:hypothetical protein
VETNEARSAFRTPGKLRGQTRTFPNLRELAVGKAGELDIGGAANLIHGAFARAPALSGAE